MGAWGSGIFENDDAADFVYEIVDRSDLSPIEAAIEQVLLMDSDYLEAPEGARALAAISILALLTNRDLEIKDAGPDLKQWIQQSAIKVPESLLAKSRRAAQRVITSPSEIMELWSESGEFETWKASVENLASKLWSCCARQEKQNGLN
jgi:hypothetical protein